MNKAGDIASSCWWVMLDGQRHVTLVDNGLEPIWLFVDTRGSMSRVVWLLSDAVAFIDAVHGGPSGYANVTSADGVTFVYSVEFAVTIRSGVVVDTSTAAEFVDVLNASTLETIRGDLAELIVENLGSLADERMTHELGLSS